MNSHQSFHLNGSDTVDMQSMTIANPSANNTLRDSVEHVMKRYFEHLEGEDVTSLYDMVLAEVEAPLLQVVMAHVNGNQTRASEVLGLNRGTLRKKLKQYDLI